MNTVSYEFAVGQHVWIVVDPERAQERCKHCNSWIRFKPLYQAEEVIVGEVSVWISQSGVNANYNLLYDNNFTHHSHGKSGKEIFATKEEAETRALELTAEWERLNS